MLIDSQIEPDESFQLQITTDDPATILGEPNVTEVVIINSDGKRNVNYSSMNCMIVSLLSSACTVSVPI